MLVGLSSIFHTTTAKGLLSEAKTGKKNHFGTRLATRKNRSRCCASPKNIKTYDGEWRIRSHLKPSQSWNRIVTPSTFLFDIEELNSNKKLACIDHHGGGGNSSRAPARLLQANLQPLCSMVCARSEAPIASCFPKSSFSTPPSGVQYWSRSMTREEISRITPPILRRVDFIEIGSLR